MDYSVTHIVATTLFVAALVHTLCAATFDKLAHRFPRHAGLLHLLGEVEVVFGFWAILLFACLAFLQGMDEALQYVETRRYSEPLFVFVVMVIAASRPVLACVTQCVAYLSHRLPGPRALVHIWLCLGWVPLMGSVITEPAAMTLSALLLAPCLFTREIPERLKYLAMGVLFVNVSVGGTLTSFAAPPVLMVSKPWGWDTAFMLQVFGWKAVVTVMVNASWVTWSLRKHAVATVPVANGVASSAMPMGVIWVHLLFLAAVISAAHHPVVFLGLFLMFLGFTQAYPQHQTPLILKEALLVAFFLAGLVVLGGLQQWWLQPLLSQSSPALLYFGALVLTAFTDNAALTYLGTLTDGLSPQAQYSLVAGAVAGGGLTVIANAPNPAGIALLRKGFANASINAGKLFKGALLPTCVAVAMLW